jgi:hypothetical protein
MEIRNVYTYLWIEVGGTIAIMNYLVWIFEKF